MSHVPLHGLRITQERTSGFLSKVIEICASPDEPIRTNAAALLAIMLFYNESNRRRLLAAEGGLALVLRLSKDPVLTVQVTFIDGPSCGSSTSPLSC